MTQPDLRQCECAVCGWRGQVRFTAKYGHCGGCGARHLISISQWLDLCDGGKGVLVLDHPDRRGKRGRDRKKRAPRRN